MKYKTLKLVLECKKPGLVEVKTVTERKSTATAKLWIGSGETEMVTRPLYLNATEELIATAIQTATLLVEKYQMQLVTTRDKKLAALLHLRVIELSKALADRNKAVPQNEI